MEFRNIFDSEDTEIIEENKEKEDERNEEDE